MYIGEYSHSVDQKGRMILPSRFRKDDLGEIFYVTKGTERCLFVYPSDEWAKFEEKLSTLPITTNPEAAAFARFFLSGAAVCEVDKQGRINIPNHLIEYAGLKKDVKVIGVRSRIEVWDCETWKTYCDEEISLENVLSNMSSIGMDF